MGLVASQHVESSWTRARTRVPCIGRRILNHCATREVPSTFISLTSILKLRKLDFPGGEANIQDPTCLKINLSIICFPTPHHHSSSMFLFLFSFLAGGQRQNVPDRKVDQAAGYGEESKPHLVYARKERRGGEAGSRLGIPVTQTCPPGKSASGN